MEMHTQQSIGSHELLGRRYAILLLHTFHVQGSVFAHRVDRVSVTRRQPRHRPMSRDDFQVLFCYVIKSTNVTDRRTSCSVAPSWHNSVRPTALVDRALTDSVYRCRQVQRYDEWDISHPETVARTITQQQATRRWANYHQQIASVSCYAAFIGANQIRTAAY